MSEDRGREGVQQIVKISLMIENMDVDDIYYWAFARSISLSLLGIAQIRKSDGVIINFFTVPLEIKGAGNGFSDLLKVGERIYLVPKESEFMLIYDIVSEQWIKVFIDVPDTGYIYKAIQKFSAAVPYKEYLYLFPCFYPAIVRYHLITGAVEYLYESMEVLNGSPAQESKGICDQVITEGAKTRFYSKRYGMILEFDMESLDIKILENFGTEKVFCAFEDEGQYYWLVPYEGDKPIIRFDKEKREKKNFFNKIPRFIPGRAPFSWCVLMNGFVWLFPGLANMALKISIDTGTVTEAEQFLPLHIETDPEMECWKFKFVKKIKDEILAFDTTSQELIRYTSSGMCVREQYGLPMEEITKLECKKLFETAKSRNLNREQAAKKSRRKNTIGEKIYHHCIYETDN